MLYKIAIVAAAVMAAAPVGAATVGGSATGGNAAAGGAVGGGGRGASAERGGGAYGAANGGIGHGGEWNGRAAAATARSGADGRDPALGAGFSERAAIHAAHAAVGKRVEGEHSTSKSPDPNYHHHPYRWEPSYGVETAQPVLVTCYADPEMSSRWWFDCSRPTKSPAGRPSGYPSGIASVVASGYPTVYASRFPLGFPSS